MDTIEMVVLSIEAQPITKPSFYRGIPVFTHLPNIDWDNSIMWCAELLGEDSGLLRVRKTVRIDGIEHVSENRAGWISHEISPIPHHLRECRVGDIIDVPFNRVERVEMEFDKARPAGEIGDE